jgi:hypothetical protein
MPSSAGSRRSTAAFTLNLPTRINREPGDDFSVDRFAHRARIWREQDRRFAAFDLEATWRVRGVDARRLAAPRTSAYGDAADVEEIVHWSAPMLQGKVGTEDREIRAALDAHWLASDANDFELEHEIYREDALLDYPQSGERIRGRNNIRASRVAQPNSKRFTVRRIVGSGDLWVTEFILAYDGRPSYSVSVMEFVDGKVARETQYFADAFEPGPSRAHWVERMG